MPLEQLGYFEVLTCNPISALGMLALLIMKQKKKLEIEDCKNLDDKIEEKFVAAFIKRDDFYMQEDFHDHTLSYWDIPKLDPCENLAMLIDNFEIPEHFFEYQVNSVLEFMKRIYHKNTSTKFYNSDKLKSLKLEYDEAKRILCATIDGLLERYFLNKKIKVTDILSAAKIKVIDSLNILDKHNQFFVDELYSDFEALEEIFTAVEKPKYVAAIKTYKEKNNAQWHDRFDVYELLLIDAKTHLQLQRHLINSHKRNYEGCDFSLNKKTNNSSACMIS